MKRKYRFLLLILVAGLVLVGCSKKMVPSVTPDKQTGEVDMASFNYIYVEALKQKLLGNPGDALKYFDQAVKINPKSDAACYQMAQILMAGGNSKSAKLYAARASNIDPSNLWYLMMLSAIYYQEQNLDSAIIYYEKAVSVYPERENLQLTLGNLYSENKNYSKALDIFDKLDLKYGVNENSTPALIKNLMAAGKYDEALTKINALLLAKPDEILYNGLLAEVFRAKGDNVKAMDVYNQLIIRNPDDPQIQMSLCGFLLDEKKYEDFLSLVNTAFINEKVSKEDKISLMAHVLEDEELVKKHTDPLILAAMVLEAAYKNDAIIVLLRPELLVKAARAEEAALLLEEIIKKQPENYYAWEKLLLVYLQEEDYDKLFVKGEECATRFNRSFLAKVLYASAAMEKEKFDIAEEEIRKAEILAGDDKDLQMQILTMKGDLYYRTKNFDKAFAVFDESLKRNSNDLTTLNNYAYYLAEQNMRLKDAEEMAKQVVSKEKNNTTFLDTYAWVLYKRGKLKEAASVMEIILSKGEKEDAEWFEHYGFILKKQKNCSAAIENFNKALLLDPSKTNLLKEIEDCKK